MDKIFVAGVDEKKRLGRERAMLQPGHAMLCDRIGELGGAAVAADMSEGMSDIAEIHVLGIGVDEIDSLP